MKISTRIQNRILEKGNRFNSNDNISEFIKEGELDELIKETADSFQEVLKSLVIDVDNDPNSKDTAHRLAKMYINETMGGRYHPPPRVASFPNDGEDSYNGMLVVRADIYSACAHHHKDVVGVAYIGVIPQTKVIGLSKYIRIARWVASRGTLQETLCGDIAKQIMKATESENVAVYLHATHGCVSCRGVHQQNSLTQTTVLHGEFKNPDVKKEFSDNIALQEGYSRK